jgi:hypothetical protein
MQRSGPNPARTRSSDRESAARQVGTWRLAFAPHRDQPTRPRQITPDRPICCHHAGSGLAAPRTSRAKGRAFLAAAIVTLTAAHVAYASSKTEIIEYFRDTAVRVHSTTESPSKRAIMHQSLQTISRAFRKLESLPLLSQGNRVDVGRLRISLEAKKDELMGIEGYERIPDAQLDAFSQLVAQDIDKAVGSATGGFAASVFMAIALVLIL